MHDRVVYRREVMRTPIRTLAAEIKISKSAVDAFYKSRTYPGKVWPKLRDWYMGQRERQLDDYQTPPENHLLSALHTLSTFPRERRAEAMRVMAENYRSLNQAMGLPVPEWVGMLSEMARREQISGPSDEPELRIPLPRKPDH
ncbi:hypothetical protein [Longimicrobium sp.]|uniref:hypothetical protein n=1 Tax=Longimicrobium sp. TaxID=2029185 RepID=UPI002C75A67C|nr:hypothetical protein [Longimicrobium sp.]HSU15646.1 hypothetical protein [Longimicrobium sp.]